MYDDYMMHYGVKGMKWGVRKDRPSAKKIGKVAAALASPTGYAVYKGVKAIKAQDPKTKRRRAEKRKTTLSKSRNYTGSRQSDALKRARRRDINKMSNADLQKTVNRLNLERQYRDLTRVNLTPGKQYVDSYNKYNNSIKTAKKTAAYSAGKKLLSAAV